MAAKKQLWVGVALMVLFLWVALFAGCSKRSPVKSDLWVPGEQKAVGQAQERALTGDKDAKGSALHEQTLTGQGLREQTLTDRSIDAKTPKTGTRETAGSEAAIPKGLQIPDIHFDFDSYTLNPANQEILKAGARAYLEHTGYQLIIEWHCDARGTAEYNLALGQKRADEAARFLTELGVSKERIKTISYGKEKPLDPGHDEAALAKNRRAHFVVIQPAR